LHPPKQSLEITDVVEWRDGEVRRVVDYLAAEEPLEVRINGTPFSVAMRTPGHDLELTAGFLLTEGIIDKADQLKEIRTVLNEKTGKNNLVEAEIVAASCDPMSMQRNFFAASSCGVCGKASIESIRRRGLRAPNPHFRVTSEVLCSWPISCAVIRWFSKKPAVFMPLVFLLLKATSWYCVKILGGTMQSTRSSVGRCSKRNYLCQTRS
jgi:formate dehydrogenase assembly factor FdhD